MKAAAILEEAVVAAAAGYVGTKVMEPLSMKLYELESDQARQREEAARPGPPYRMAAEKLASLLGKDLDDQALERWGMAFHYGLAVSWAPVYGLLRRKTPMGPLTAGLATGAAMSVVVDEGLTPALGLSARNRAYPLATHVRGVVAHLVFGLVVAGVSEAAWALLRRRP